MLALIAFGPPGDWLWAATGGPWWARTLELTALVLAVSTPGPAAALGLARLGLGAALGFSTQSFGAWLGDVAKGLSLGAVLTGLGLTALVWSARVWPTWWPVPAALGAAALTLLLSLLAPLLFERLFNRFEPLADEELARDLRELSERAGVPVRTTLVADASRRTTKHNAYVSGLGPTRRLVLYDTLLRDSPVPELRGSSPTSSATAASATSRAGLRWRCSARPRRCSRCGSSSLGTASSRRRAADGPGDPRIVPLVLLVLWRARARRAAVRDLALAPLGARGRPLRTSS